MKLILKRAESPIKLFCFGLFFCLSILIFAKYWSDFRRSEERGRVVSSMLKEQDAARVTNPDIDFNLKSTFQWMNESPELERWLVAQVARGVDPVQIASDLEGLSTQQIYSEVMANSLKRWIVSLREWGKSREIGDTLPPRRLLELGRLRNFEASGYQRTGKEYDAAVLYLWSNSLLTQFVIESPQDPYVAEALYLLGMTDLRLRHVASKALRADRLLNLCSELYPRSIWASQAYALWRTKLGSGA